MPPAIRTSVPAAAMMSVADCWSRMLSRLALVGNELLVSDRTMKRIEERHQDRRAAQATCVRADVEAERG